MADYTTLRKLIETLREGMPEITAYDVEPTDDGFKMVNPRKWTHEEFGDMIGDDPCDEYTPLVERGPPDPRRYRPAPIMLRGAVAEWPDTSKWVSNGSFADACERLAAKPGDIWTDREPRTGWRGLYDRIMHRLFGRPIPLVETRYKCIGSYRQ